MIVSVELWIAVSAPTCQPLRLTWDVITYRFARSIVTKLHKIFEYIYHFPFHVSLDSQTTQMFCCSHHAVTTTTTIEDEERWSFEYRSRALRLRGVAGGPRGKAHILHTVNITYFMDWKQFFWGLLVPGVRRADNSEYLSWNPEFLLFIFVLFYWSPIKTQNK